MTIWDDWARVMKVREANATRNATLPFRFYAACCYSDECKAFIEKHQGAIAQMLSRMQATDRAA